MNNVDLLKALERALSNGEKVHKRETENYARAIWSGIHALHLVETYKEELRERAKKGPPRFGRQLDP